MKRLLIIMFMISLMLITLKGTAALNGDQVLLSTSQQESHPSWSESKRLINVRVVQPTKSSTDSSALLFECDTATIGYVLFLQHMDSGHVEVTAVDSKVNVATVFNMQHQDSGHVEVTMIDTLPVITTRPESLPYVISANINTAPILKTELKTVTTADSYHVGTANYGAVWTETATGSLASATTYLTGVGVDNSNSAATATLMILRAGATGRIFTATVAANSTEFFNLSLTPITLSNTSAVNLTNGANATIIWKIN